jgi:hypothetical protein
MAVLVVAALFWGNCFSCPQLLLTTQRHGCCPHTKSAKTECQTQGLRNFVKAEKSFVAAIVAVASVEQAPQIAERATPQTEPHTEDHAPPDALPLRI